MSADDAGLTMSDPLSAPTEGALSMSGVLDSMAENAATPSATPIPPSAPHPSITAAQASDASGAGGGGGSLRAVSEEERRAMSELNRKREALKAEYYERQQKTGARKAIEDRVIAAVQGRTAAATHGAKDLLSFVKGNSEMEDMAAKNFARFSALFGQETGSANDALLGYSSSCKSMQKLHADLQNMLASVEVKRSEEALAAVEEASKKLNAQGAQLLADLGSSRDKLDKALAAQEKAWADCLDAESKDKGVSSADSDPWIAAVRYQAASKGLETVEAAHASDLRRVVKDLKEMDAARLSTMKSVLRSYADSRRSLLSKALQHAEELCSMVEQIQPDADCTAFLQSADVIEEELVEQAPPDASDATTGTAPPPASAGALGVWIPDDAVRNCNKCQQGFGLMRRKHHCRRCGHVFCDKCSARTCVLPASFGFGNQQQRVCDTCLELVQAGQGEMSGADEAAGGNSAATDMEVRREGSLLKKGGIGQQYKPRYFVCTRAGFLHYFDSKFDLTPKGSIPLHQARIATVDDDACALAIESADGSAVSASAPSPAANMMKSFLGSKSSKKERLVLRSALGSNDRDDWIGVLRSCSRADQSVAAAGAAAGE